MQRLALLVTTLLLSTSLLASQPKIPNSRDYTGPIIDVHVHVYPANGNGPAPNAICIGPASNLQFDPVTPWPQRMVERMMDPPCENPIKGPATDEEVRDQTIAALKRNNARAVLSGFPDEVAEWMELAPEMFIPGRALNIVRDEGVTPEVLGQEYRGGGFKVLGEVSNQYAGILADDPQFEAYWDLAAELDFPVGIHTGIGPPGAPNGLAPSMELQSPRVLMPILKKHPSLRVYLMHAGYPFMDDLKAMLYFFPQLYVDTGVLQLAVPREEYYAYLEELVRAGYIDRIMFGSDQMNWPGLIEEGIRAINDAPFLSYDQKKDILHDNAVRFFRLEE